MEYSKFQNVETFLQKNEGFFFNEMNIKIFMNKLIQIVDHMHEKKIMHRDIKCSNILISDDGNEVKLIDFGVAKKANVLDLTFSPQGDFRFRAPEMINDLGYNQTCDIWQCGLLIYSLLYGKNITTKKYLEQKFNPERDFPHFSSTFFETLKRMTCKNPEIRVSAKEILNGEWMQDKN